MNLTTKTLSYREQTPRWSILLASQSVIMIMHLILQLVIYRAKLRDTQYHLIKLLSLFDVIFSVKVVIFASLMFVEVENELVFKLLSAGGMVTHTMSLYVTNLVVIDRYMAVMYCLSYYRLVTRNKIHFVLFVSGTVTTVGFCCIQFFSTARVNKLNRTNYNLIITGNIIRIATCINIFILGKITLKERNKSENAFRATIKSHGIEAEKLYFWKGLKRSIKDVLHLNFWTCLCLVPICIVSFLIPLQVGDQEELFSKMNIYLNAVHTISNPIIYMFSFTKIRKSLFKRNNSIGPMEMEIRNSTVYGETLSWKFNWNKTVHHTSICFHLKSTMNRPQWKS